MLVNFIGGPEITINEINDAAEFISKRCAPEALFLFGYGQRAELADRIQVTVVATGFGASAVDSASLKSGMGASPRNEPARPEPLPSSPASPYLPTNLPKDYGVNVGNFSEFDTPTYLRRQMD